MMRALVSSNVRSQLERALWAVPLSLTLLVIRGTFAVGRPLAFAELLYLSDQALRLGLCVAVLLCALAWVDRRVPARRAPALGLALLALCAPKAWQAAQHFADADAMVRRGIPPAAPRSAVLAVLAVLVVLSWGYQRVPGPSRAWHGGAVLALATVIVVDATVGFSQSGLVPFCYGLAVVILTVMVGALSSRTTVAFRGALALNALVGLAGLIGLAMPATVARARAGLHSVRSSLAHLDMHLTRRDSAPSLVEKFDTMRAQDCDTLPAKVAALDLPTSQRKNVIVISIDSVRADDARARVGGKPLMPELTRFMEESWTAPQAYSAYPATLMSLSSTFSGLLPSTLMIESPAPPSLVGRALQETHERVTVLPKGSYFLREPIEHYIVQGSQRIAASGAAAQTEQAVAKLKELRAQGKPHVLWIHYIEPHEPYVHHKEFGPADSARERYRSELAHVDRQLGKLLAALRAGGWYDDSAIFVFSDHGEAFGEHRQNFHHFQLYPWLIQVPFAAHFPKKTPRTLSGPVQLTDVAATALEFVGASPRLSLEGRSLLSNPPEANRVIVSEEFPAMMRTLNRYARASSVAFEEALRRAQALDDPRGYPSKVAVLQGGHELVLHRGTGVMELYDLTRDPGAEDNLAYAEPGRRDAYAALLDGWFMEIARRARCADQAPRLARP